MHFRLLLHTCLLILMTSWVTGSMSQNPITNVNSSIRIIGGEAFYLHQVLEGQEVEDIAAAYYTQVSDILRANPQIRTGLVPGMELKIPCSDASVEFMSSGASPAPMPQTEQSSLAEAMNILALESPPAQPQPEPRPDSLPELEELSKAVNESIENLNKIRESLEQIPVPAGEDTAAQTQVAAPEAERVDTLLEQPAPPMIPTPAEVQEIPAPATATESHRTSGSVSGLLDQYQLRFFEEHPADSVFYMSEYFFVTVDARGRILSVQDERTVTNKNTRWLDPAELNGLMLDNSGATRQGEKLALGLEVRLKRHDYEVRIKRKKVRLYRYPMYVEYFPKDHPHGIAILKAAEEAGRRGKQQVTVYDGLKEIGLYRPFEYNPFGVKENTLVSQPLLRIEGIGGVK